jgi:hypothetical protein
MLDADGQLPRMSKADLTLYLDVIERKKEWYVGSNTTEENRKTLEAMAWQAIVRYESQHI